MSQDQPIISEEPQSQVEEDPLSIQIENEAEDNNLDSDIEKLKIPSKTVPNSSQASSRMNNQAVSTGMPIDEINELIN